MQDRKRRVLIIGLDGATWDLMDPWIAAGQLPTLAQLQQNGASGDLLSTIHPVTTPAWISFMTGRQQGQHGIFDHVQRRPGSYALEIMDATKIRSPLLFDYLAEAGLRTISINMPLTFPPPRIDGLLVSGLFGTIVGPEITHPPELYEQIARIAPGYVVHPDYDPRAERPLEKYQADLLQSIVDRTAVAETLLADNEWDVGLVVYTATDQIQHAFWRDMLDENPKNTLRGAVFDVYKLIDENLQRLLQFADADTLVLLMSDHGAGPLHGFVNVNRWLADEGLLAFKVGRDSNRRSDLITRAASAYKRYVPTDVRAAIRKNLQTQFTQAKARMESELFAAAIDWENTQAYSIGAGGNIFINQAGREPQGSVPPGADYEALRERIIARLRPLRAPDGRPLVKDVLRREDVYHGRYSDLAPDLIITWHDYGWWGRARYNQSRLELFEMRSHWDFSTLPLTGSHRPEGVLIARGPGIAPQTVTDARLIDLTPTLLAFLGLPVPHSMDGRVLTQLFAPEALHVTYRDDDLDPGGDNFHFSGDEEAKITRHLKDLGYI